ncbi:hypothetical protein A2767_01465 [Candidatus Roizmanbacteria bacterium RIFCSPHIGHO2_01_FULL_35_10]|uniref:DUF5655 domain-containing protein n=1 Tax=Candidatus Roizmanbacteria bacterium RIFCSPLOWO2_01_FULL_35_13 TaxID=1802055 RepID=A0A1F7IAV7_9BACT|nr:MAG: hypothetical protein A2767_01465 [Candidatus Roizmanbacteria bacterium RIFCSPHIGHO2_01_FULL_35_10]OGK40501.1 MAG: hypothetical protein A3A74_02830 [Candidatus Roizmanbacteria bacterium RIFCSPLOWO2_01_FULL_35_13]
MPLFKLQNDNLEPIVSKDFKEKTLQSITEENLNKIFNLKFVSTEFSLHNFRIDTLAFDEENSSFVIVEYKKDRSFSVIDQGYSYLSLLLNNKADFILEYNEKNNKSLKREDVDWTQSRVIFVAKDFTSYQSNAINFRDLPIELWEAKLYQNDIFLYNQLKSPDTNESIKTVSKSKTIESVSREVKKYTISDHFKEGWEKSKELYEILEEKIFNLDARFTVSPQKYYIGFKIGNQVVIGVKIRKSKLIIRLNRVQPKDLVDPEKKVKYLKNSFEYYHKHISDYEFTDEKDIDYGVFLIKQVHEKFYK